MFTKFQLVAFASPRTHQVRLLGYFAFPLQQKKVFVFAEGSSPGPLLQAHIALASSFTSYNFIAVEVDRYISPFMMFKSSERMFLYRLNCFFKVVLFFFHSLRLNIARLVMFFISVIISKEKQDSFYLVERNIQIANYCRICRRMHFLT